MGVGSAARRDRQRAWTPPPIGLGRFISAAKKAAPTFNHAASGRIAGSAVTLEPLKEESPRVEIPGHRLAIR